MKILIAIPTLDYMHFEFVKSLTALVTRLKDDGIDFDVRFEGNTLVYVARDKIAKAAIDGGYTHVLWLDSDMIFTEDLIEDLSFCGQPYVSGICHGRRPPHFSCLFHSLTPLKRFEEYPTSPFRIAGSGFGCVLMETAVLQQIWDKYKTCFLPMEKYGEDLAFCLRCQLSGIPMYADPSVRLGHIGHIAIYPGDEERWKSSIHGGS